MAQIRELDRRNVSDKDRPPQYRRVKCLETGRMIVPDLFVKEEDAPSVAVQLGLIDKPKLDVECIVEARLADKMRFVSILSKRIVTDIHDPAQQPIGKDDFDMRPRPKEAKAPPAPPSAVPDASGSKPGSSTDPPITPTVEPKIEPKTKSSPKSNSAVNDASAKQAAEPKLNTPSRINVYASDVPKPMPEWPGPFPSADKASPPPPKSTPKTPTIASPRLVWGSKVSPKPPTAKCPTPPQEPSAEPVISADVDRPPFEDRLESFKDDVAALADTYERFQSGYETLLANNLIPEDDNGFVVENYNHVIDMMNTMMSTADPATECELKEMTDLMKKLKKRNSAFQEILNEYLRGSSADLSSREGEPDVGAEDEFHSAGSRHESEASDHEDSSDDTPPPPPAPKLVKPNLTLNAKGTTLWPKLSPPVQWGSRRQSKTPSPTPNPAPAPAPKVPAPAPVPKVSPLPPLPTETVEDGEEDCEYQFTDDPPVAKASAKRPAPWDHPLAVFDDAGQEDLDAYNESQVQNMVNTIEGRLQKFYRPKRSILSFQSDH